MEGYKENARKLCATIEAGLPLEQDLSMFQAGKGPRLGSDPTVGIYTTSVPENIDTLDEIVEAFIEEDEEKELSREQVIVDGRLI